MPIVLCNLTENGSVYAWNNDLIPLPYISITLLFADDISVENLIIYALLYQEPKVLNSVGFSRTFLEQILS